MKITRRSLLSLVGVHLGLVVVFAISAVVWFVTSHRESSPASCAVADAEFTQLRARFSSQEPLIDMSARAAAPLPAPPAAAAPLHVFHTVIFDTRGRKRLVHIAVPYWFARCYARHDGAFIWLGELTFLDDTEFDPEKIRLSLAQLERRGPGLVADYRHPGGGQFISWVD